MERFLITTADERTWKFDRPVIFLGEWCKRHDRKHIWENMDAIVARPYGLQTRERLDCIDKGKDIINHLLPELTHVFNDIHNVNFNERYWNLIVGHWLQRYVRIITNRHNTLLQAIQNYEITETACFETDKYSLVNSDFSGFSLDVRSDLWNHILYSRLLSDLDGTGINIVKIKLEDVNYPFGLSHTHINPSNSFFKKLLRSVIVKGLALLRRDSDALIVNSFLPFKEEIKLHLSLMQVPQIMRTPSVLPNNVDYELRSKLTVSVNSYSGTEYHVRILFHELLPTCYLEGRNTLLKKVEDLGWPKKPKFIFTSNNFSFDEVFKLWTAEKINQGIPYIVGQHGANYGTFYGCEIWPEITTSDKFLSWGWGNCFYEGINNVLPAFNFKILGMKSKAFSVDGNLLLIERGPGTRDGPQDRCFEHILLQKDVFNFFDHLSRPIQDKTIVRLHHGSNERGASDQALWSKHSPSTKLDIGNSNLWDLINNSRVVVFAYDSAGILETLALNIPTICFWRGGLGHLLPSAKPFYEMLKSVGILADTPEDAALHISTNWDDITLWWNSYEVQNVRKVFCEKYSNLPSKPITTLKSLLIS